MAEIAESIGSRATWFNLVARWLLWPVLCLAIAAVLLDVVSWPREEHFAGPFPEAIGKTAQTRALFISLTTPALLSWYLSPGGDSSEDPAQSDLRLWINGDEVGPSHQVHDDIHQGKAAGVSHWFGSVIFSLPPGVENTSATRVMVRYSLRPWHGAVRLLVWASVLLGVAGYWRSGMTALRRGHGFADFLSARYVAIRRLIHGVAPRSVDRCIRLLVALTAILIVADLGGYFDRSGIIPTSTIRPLQGNEYRVPGIAGIFEQSRIAALFYAGEGDSGVDPQTSTLRLFEDGRALGVPHSAHLDIVDHGAGRYSHWGQQLQFSSSDNSDPRVNGRVYSVVEKPAIWRLLLVPGLLIVPLFAWRQRAGLAHGLPEINVALTIFKSDALWFGVTGVLAVYVVSYYIVGAPPIPLIASDSSTYWFGSGIVPVGYPIFLWTVYGLFGSLKAIVIAQVALFAIAVITAQFGIKRVTGSSAVAGVTAIVLLVLGSAASTAIWLLAESVVTSAILFHVAAAAYVLKRPTRLNLTLLALTAVFAITIRPAAYFLLGGIVFLALFWHGHRRTLIRTAVPAVCVFLLVFYGVGAAIRGQASQSITGLVLFPHVAHLYDGPPPGASADLPALTDTPVLRSYKVARGNAPTWQARQELETMNFNPVLHEVLKIPNRRLSRAELEIILKQKNEVLAPLSFNLITHHPIGYLSVVSENVGAWMMNYMFATTPYVRDVLSDQYTDFWGQITAFYRGNLKKETGVTLSDVKNRYLLTGPSELLPAFAVPIQLQTPVKIAFLAIAVVLIVSLIAGYAGPAAAFTAYVGALAFGGALVVAMSTVFIPRYAIPLDPLVLIVVAVGGWRALVWFLSIWLSRPQSASSTARSDYG